jgi:hypothetical protein
VEQTPTGVIRDDEWRSRRAPAGRQKQGARRRRLADSPAQWTQQPNPVLDDCFHRHGEAKLAIAPATNQS